MSTRASSPRLPSGADGPVINGRAVPYGTGVLPGDFVERLERLKEASGLTWNGFADAVGVDKKQLHRWRLGTEPCGGAMHALFRLAPWIPGGLDLLMGDGFQASLVQMSLWED